MNLKTGFQSTQIPDGSMELYLARPASEKRLPVILVLQEAFGVNDHIQDLCERFAKEGYLAVAPELFHRSGKHTEVAYSNRYRAMPLLGKLSEESLSRDLKATIHFLKTLPNADITQIASVGFCMGGYASVLASMILDLKVAVSFYGAGLVHSREEIGYGPLIQDFKNIRCPLLLFFGEEDLSIPEDERNLIFSELESHQKSFQFRVFPDSNHGFFCDQRRSYNEKAASEAWEMTTNWLKKHFCEGFSHREEIRL